ncbi:MAG: sugar phosphate isomerase/epimerase family protein [Sphaerochaetaceae bacterium]
MDAFYKDKNEYAVSTFTFENEPLKDALESIAGHGFSTVELWGDTVHLDPRAQADLPQVRRWMEDGHLHAHSLHTPFRNFPHFGDKAEGEAWRLSLWKQSLDICNQMEIPIAVIHAMNRLEYNYNYDRLGYIHDLMENLAVYAAKRGVRLALENIPSGKPGAGEVLCTLVEQTRLFGDIKELAWCLDIGHVTITSNDMQGEIDCAMDRLITFHIHNNDGLQDLHNTPDMGVIDWPKWHDYLRMKGFGGQFVLEVEKSDNPYGRMDAMAALFGER